MKNRHNEDGVRFEIQFGLFIKIWAGKHMFYIWQETITLDKRKYQLFFKETNSMQVKVDLYDLVIFDHFWPSDWRENRCEF